MLLNPRLNNNKEDWLPISDLMSGLMVIFILITISYIYAINKEREAIRLAQADIDIKKLEIEQLKVDLSNKINKLKEKKKEIIEIKNEVLNVSKKFSDIGAALNQYLRREFSKDLKRWNAEILSDNTIRFKSPEVIFDSGESNLKPEFIIILDDFIPRYIGVLQKFSDKNYISEIRIEGHTSSTWGSLPEKEAYIKNSELSQKRAFTVLQYILTYKINNDFNWLRGRLRANGLSSSNLILKQKIEDGESSRRVEFRVIVNIEDTLTKIKDAMGKLTNVTR